MSTKKKKKISELENKKINTAKIQPLKKISKHRYTLV